MHYIRGDAICSTKFDKLLLYDKTVNTGTDRKPPSNICAILKIFFPLFSFNWFNASAEVNYTNSYVKFKNNQIHNFTIQYVYREIEIYSPGSRNVLLLSMFITACIKRQQWPPLCSIPFPARNSVQHLVQNAQKKQLHGQGL